MKDLDLSRYPENPRDQLRAWDASDEYLLDHLDPAQLEGTVVIAGDRWGALTTALAAHDPIQITDSLLTREATRENFRRNGLDPDKARLLTTLDPPPERIDTLLVRVPKSLALLEDTLHRLAPSVHEGTVVAGTGMVAEIHTSTLRLFEDILGPTRTSLAVRKARLIFCTPTGEPPAKANPWPLTYTLPELGGATIVNRAGIFCADRLDIGTRFLLANMPDTNGAGKVVDLGCGNGVVGLAVALENPGAEVTMVDESYQAVASAQDTFAANPGVKGVFGVADGMSGIEAESVDLVINNPPFHSQRATSDHTAWGMFTGAKRALRPGGELWVIGNRHLGYHLKLRRLFGNCEVLASDPKFVLLRAVK
ncbi:methyltransferase [Nonomuraea sp. NBC_01738]|uniref:methyltransferase n=1 Tax=Nonomuraea sp. NBC_01738 TaxID=2976003 RepID=UPI002E117AB1|nr:methyltransferase [Nonomuraea sp. NBC_01738]